MLVPDYQASILFSYAVIGLKSDLTVNSTNITCYNGPDFVGMTTVSHYWGEPDVISRYRIVNSYHDNA